MRLNRPVAVALGIARAVPVALHAQNHDTVWVWNARCYDPTVIAILVHLDGRPVYRSTMPICRWERRFEKGRASFRFTPQRPLVWYGYRSDEGDSTPDVGDTTAANTPFEIDLWQAGGETDAIELGFQALARDGLHMNSIHFVWPTKPGATTMAPGLVLETWPEPRPSHGDAGGQQASRPETFEGTYVLDTTGLAPLPFFTPGLIPRGRDDPSLGELRAQG